MALDRIFTFPRLDKPPWDNALARPRWAWLVALGSLVVALAPLVSATGLWAAPIPVSELAEPGLAFKRYLAEMPPIKRIVFEQSHHDGRFSPGIMLADAAVQPNGYFMRHLSNSPWSSNLVVFGLSSEKVWTWDMETKWVTYGMRGGWPSRTVNKRSYEYYWMSKTYEMLQEITRFGIPCRTPPNLSWISQTEFEFSGFWSDYAGRITRFDGNRPVQVVYESKPGDRKAGHDKPVHVKIDYEYEPGQDFPPRRFVIDTGRAKVTNIIHRLEIGLDPNATEGYRLTDFLPGDARVEQVFWISNSVRHVVHADGTTIPYRYRTPPVDRPGPRATRHSIVLFSLACLCATAVFLARQVRSRFRSAKTVNTPNDQRA